MSAEISNKLEIYLTLSLSVESAISLKLKKYIVCATPLLPRHLGDRGRYVQVMLTSRQPIL